MTQDNDPITTPLTGGYDFDEPSTDSNEADGYEPDVEPAEDERAERHDSASEGSPAARRRSNLTRPQVRRIVSKTLEVQSTPDDIRSLVAAALGVDEDLNDLVPAIITSTAKSTAVFSDIGEISGADPMEAVVLAASHDRDRLRAMHRILQEIGAADTATLNASDVKAGMTIAKAAQSLDSDQVSNLMGAAALVGR